MQYFTNCKNINEAKSTYKNLAKQFHPDIAQYDTTAIMQAINSEYAFAIAKLAKGDTNLSSEQVEDEILNAEAYKNAVNVAINLNGITIELCGGWLWIGGNTYPVRASLKEAGFMFACAKKMWYFRSPEYATNNRKKMDIDQIRSKYGSQQILSNTNKKVLAF
jgi:hypothetical protein